MPIGLLMIVSTSGAALPGTLTKPGPFIGGAWAAAGALFTNVDSTPVSANSAVCVTRSVELPGEVGLVVAPLPYDPFAE